MCGVHPFYVPRSDPDKIDVNARCLDGFDALAIVPEALRRPELGSCNAEGRALAMNTSASTASSAMAPSQLVRVYYEDTDFSGIVYHANYLRFMERGRTNYLRLIGADQRALFEEPQKEAPGFAFVVRSMASTSSSPREWTTCSKSSPSRQR